MSDYSLTPPDPTPDDGADVAARYRDALRPVPVAVDAERFWYEAGRASVTPASRRGGWLLRAYAGAMTATAACLAVTLVAPRDDAAPAPGPGVAAVADADAPIVTSGAPLLVAEDSGAVRPVVARPEWLDRMLASAGASPRASYVSLRRNALRDSAALIDEPTSPAEDEPLSVGLEREAPRARQPATARRLLEEYLPPEPRRRRGQAPAEPPAAQAPPANPERVA